MENESPEGPNLFPKITKGNNSWNLTLSLRLVTKFDHKLEENRKNTVPSVKTTKNTQFLKEGFPDAPKMSQMNYKWDINRESPSFGHDSGHPKSFVTTWEGN